MRQDSPKVWSEPSFETSTKTFQIKISLIDIKQSWLPFSKTDCAMILWWLIPRTSPSRLSKTKKNGQSSNLNTCHIYIYIFFFFTSPISDVMLEVDSRRHGFYWWVTDVLHPFLQKCSFWSRAAFIHKCTNLITISLSSRSSHVSEMSKQLWSTWFFRAPSSLFLVFFFLFFFFLNKLGLENRVTELLFSMVTGRQKL